MKIYFGESIFCCRSEYKNPILLSISKIEIEPKKFFFGYKSFLGFDKYVGFDENLPNVTKIHKTMLLNVLINLNFRRLARLLPQTFETATHQTNALVISQSLFKLKRYSVLLCLNFTESTQTLEHRCLETKCGLDDGVETRASALRYPCDTWLRL